MKKSGRIGRGSDDLVLRFPDECDGFETGHEIQLLDKKRGLDSEESRAGAKADVEVSYTSRIHSFVGPNSTELCS